MSKSKYLILTILVLCFLVRMLVFVQLYKSPVIEIPIADSRTYLVLAEDVAKGDLLASRTTFTNPLYFYFVALVWRFLGFIISNPIIPVILVQIMLSCITIFILFKITVILFELRIAILTITAASLYEILVFFDNTLLSTSLINFLNLIMLYLLLKFDEVTSLKYIFYSGVICGLSIITRANLLIFIPFVLIWYYVRTNSQRKNFLKHTAIFLSGLIIIISVIVIRNYALTGEFILVSSNLGYNFYVGNNEKANGTYNRPEFIHSTYQYYEEKESEREANKRSGRVLSHNEASWFWFMEGMHFVYKNPVKYLHLQYRKLYLFFNNVETANNLSNYTAHEYSTLLKFLPQNFGLMSAFGILGIVFSIKKSRFRRTLPVLLIIITYLLSNLIFMTASEYRAPIIIFLIMYATFALDILLNLFKTKQYKTLLLILIPIILFIYWTNRHDDSLDVYRSTDADYAAFGNELTISKKYEDANFFYLEAIKKDSVNKYMYFLIADNYRKDGYPNLALRYYKLSPRIDDIADSMKLGYLELTANDLFYKGDFKNAEIILERTVKYERDNYTLLNNLGTCYLNLEDYDRAEKYFTDAVRIKSDYPPSLANIGLIKEKRNQLPESIYYFEQADKFNPSNPKYKLKLIELYLKTHQLNSAREIITVLENDYPLDSDVIKELLRIRNLYKEY